MIACHRALGGSAWQLIDYTLLALRNEVVIRVNSCGVDYDLIPKSNQLESEEAETADQFGSTLALPGLLDFHAEGVVIAVNSADARIRPTYIDSLDHCVKSFQNGQSQGIFSSDPHGPVEPFARRSMCMWSTVCSGSSGPVYVGSSGCACSIRIRIGPSLSCPTNLRLEVGFVLVSVRFCKLFKSSLGSVGITVPFGVTMYPGPPLCTNNPSSPTK